MWEESDFGYHGRHDTISVEVPGVGVDKADQTEKLSSNRKKNQKKTSRSNAERLNVHRAWSSTSMRPFYVSYKWLSHTQASMLGARLADVTTPGPAQAAVPSRTRSKGNEDEEKLNGSGILVTTCAKLEITRPEQFPRKE